MHGRLFLFLYSLLFWTGSFPVFAETSPEVFRMTEKCGQNVTPLLAVDSEGRVWVAWLGNKDGDWDLYARYVAHDGWSSEIVIMDNPGDIADFDMAANGINEIWFACTTWAAEPDTVVREARFYSQGEVRRAYSDTLTIGDIKDELSNALFTFSFGSIGKLFFSKNDKPFLASGAVSLIITDLITGESNRVFVPIESSLADWGDSLFGLARTGDDSFWLASTGFWHFSGGIEGKDLIARYLWDGEWNGFRVAWGQTIDLFSIEDKISFRAIGADRSRRVYFAYAWDDDPSLETNYHLIVHCFDAATADSLGQWCFTDAQVAITDDSDLVGFILNRDGDIFVRALLDFVWYKPMELENDPTIVSAHPDAVVDRLGNIWVAWDDGKDIYVSSVHLSDMEVDDVLTSVESDSEDMDAMPAELLLTPNYPNPFNASTAIVFSIPFDTIGTLSFYDLLGQQVRTLVHGALESGEYGIIWDGKDDAGRAVSSGVYLYRLTVDGGRWTKTRKMVLIR